MIKIGYFTNDYLIKRLVLHKIENAKYVSIFGFNVLVLYLLRIFRKIGFKLDSQIFNWRYTFFGKLPGKKINFIHFFNHVYLHSSVNWISSFETVLPRYRRVNIAAIKSMANRNCKAILALSMCSYNMEAHMLESFPEYKDKILQKMFVLHPPQKLLIENITDKKRNDKLTFIFIGNDFFRKGGIEMLNAFDRLNNRNALKFIVISNMTINDYVTHSNESHKKQALDFFAKNSSWLDFYDGLPNDEVLQFVKDSDIGLLPTKADTYGFSVLEMQAAGVPVISTDVRALPEINDDECGWIIPVTKNKLGEALYSDEQELSNLSKEIENGLYSILIEILNKYNRNEIDFIRKKGEKCFNRIKKEHDPRNYGLFLKKITDIEEKI